MSYNFSETEKKIINFWQENKIFEKLRQKNQGKKHWSFLDGPITANNPMGIHHAWGRTYKDMFQRYKAMRGFDERFQSGFDCQGLWVEVQVEKELGFRTKKDIEKYGIEEFIAKCKERVLKYSEIQTLQSIRLGQWMDWENSYYTMSDENNYAIWYFLKKCHEAGLLYKGRDVVPWCPRCVDGSSKILLSDGLSKSIKELKNCWRHHKVVGFAERENKMAVAPIRDYITIPKEPIFRLSTVETDRLILVTADHPFWVKGKEWTSLDKINIGEKVAVYPHPEIFEDKSVDKKILDEEDLKNIITDIELKREKKRMRNKVSHYRDLVTIDKWVLDKKIRLLMAQNCTLRGIQKKILLKHKVKISFNTIRQVDSVKKKNRTLEYVIHELKMKGLLPLTTKNPKLLIISRLLGHIFGDGFLSLTSGKRINFSVGFTGRKEDLNEIREDLDKLGFSYEPINKRFTTSSLRDRLIRGYSTEFRANSLTLSVLLAVLGAPVGKKSRTHFEVPRWLFGAPKHIVREFLAAYFGSELTKIKIHRKKFDALQFSLNKDEKLVKDGHNFVRQISKLLKKFNVKIQNIRFRSIFARKDGSKSVKITAIFSGSKENLLNFCKFVGYRYSKERENIARSVQEYLEVKEKLKERKMRQYERIFKLKERGLTIVKISKMLHLPKRKIEEILCTKSFSNIKVNNLPIFSKWLKEATDDLTNPFVWETVKEIKKIGVKDVFDISVNPLHSFVVNSFVTHNCGTAISQHEILTEEYKWIVHKAIFLKLPILGQENTYFLVWTTTPWTLPANVALAVHPDLDYAKVKTQTGDIFILLKDKISLIEKGRIIETFKGEKLKDWQYQGLFDELPSVKEALKNYQHSLILWDKVIEEEGTGIVHIAPGCGEEDFQLSKEFKFPVINPTDDESRYKQGFGILSGKFVSEVETRDLIFENLKNKNLLFKIEDYKHRYPTCWRCKTELIFRLVDEWYIKMDPLRKPLMKTVSKIRWIPSFGRERELDWLKNMKDWLISKKRYWGLALPIFECQKCNNFEVIGSKDELKEKVIEGWKEFEGHSPHRPRIDKVKIKCPKCGQLVSRIPDVGNPWLDAGIVPFSTIKYFSDKDFWKKWFPADFICESLPGQFKNWFYSLLCMSQVLEGSYPFKTVFGYAMVVDEKGEEMHKSKGNVIWFDEGIEKIGAEVMRWMYLRQNPVYNLRFGYNVASEIKRKLLTLSNSYAFFETYGEKSIRRSANKNLKSKSQTESQNLLDKWIISRLNGLIKEVGKSLDKYDPSRASLAIEDFFINDLSLWYIRRSRKRFQNPASEKEKEEAENTLYFVLLNLTKLIAPMLPFFAEEVYQKLKTNNLPLSIHLFDWPESEKKLIDKKLEKEMKEVREIVTKVLAKRTALGIKVRQPLAKLRIRREELKLIKELMNLIKEEVNIKEIVFVSRLEEEVELDTTITPELKEEGLNREIIRHIQDLRKKAGLTPKDKVVIYYETGPEFEKFLLKNKNPILKETKSEDIQPFLFGTQTMIAEKKIEIDQKEISLAIKKVENNKIIKIK